MHLYHKASEFVELMFKASVHRSTVLYGGFSLSLFKRDAKLTRTLPLRPIMSAGYHISVWNSCFASVKISNVPCILF